MNSYLPKCLKVFLCSILWLPFGATSQVHATPLILNFQIDDPLQGVYDNAHFSYRIDLDSPFWSSVEGYDPFDQNAFKYKIEFYDADPAIGILPDLIMSTGQTIHDWESGYTHFRDSTFSFDFSAGNTYLGQIIDLVNSGGHAWSFNGFHSESMGFTSENYPTGPSPGVRLYSTTPMPVPEPSTLLLLCTGFVGVAWSRRKNKQQTLPTIIS